MRGDPMIYGISALNHASGAGGVKIADLREVRASSILIWAAAHKQTFDFNYEKNIPISISSNSSGTWMRK